MANIADVIEEFIMRQLAVGAGTHVVLRRNELADELECAPSQISYVLSTRFTVERGFVVESRRGLGGFVRIVRTGGDAQPREAQAAAARPLNGNTPPGEVMAAVEAMRQRGLVSGRETEMVRLMLPVLYHCCQPAQRVQVLEGLFRLLGQYPQGGD